MRVQVASWQAEVRKISSREENSLHEFNATSANETTRRNCDHRSQGATNCYESKRTDEVVFVKLMRRSEVVKLDLTELKIEI